MNVHSVSWFRDDASAYESENAGVARGVFFVNFLPTLIRAHITVFNGWELWIYHDNRVKGYPYWNAIQRMHDANILKLIPMGDSKGLCDSMLWRMETAKWDNVDWFISRDIDSLPMHRDRIMVEEAMSSGAAVHAIMDSESHCGPLMGGMTAYHAKSLMQICPEVLSRMPNIDYTKHGSDQIHLNRIVWPKMKGKTFIHQKRKSVMYPDAMRTKSVAPQETVLDRVVNHIGAGYDVDKARSVLDEFHSSTRFSDLKMLETGSFPMETPWYTPGAVAWLNQNVKPEWSVLEFGGGCSTKWYADRCRSVVTVESHPLWMTMIRSIGSPVVTLCDKYTGHDKFDLVIVDGADRIGTINAHRGNVRPGGHLILDNSDSIDSRVFEIMSDWESQTFVSGSWWTTIWRRPCEE